MTSGEERRSLSKEEEEEEEAYMFAKLLTNLSVLPMVLKAVVELGILEIIAKAGPGAQLSASEIAAQLPTQNPEAPLMLDRMLRLLVTHSILSCSQTTTLDDGSTQRFYGPAPVCKFLVKNQDGVSLAPLILMNQDKVLMESWYNLRDAVLEGGIPFNKAHGMIMFDYNGTDLRFNKVFNKGMSNHSTITMKKILETYEGFQGLNSLVDVGGGVGATLNMIVSKYPSMSLVINFDLPHVLADAPAYTGIQHIGGDMFVSVPKADAIFMKWICHDWSDQHCLKLLKNCYDALPQHGKVIVVEGILPANPEETSFAAKTQIHTDIVMLGHHEGGKERTEWEFQALAKRAGFPGFRVACYAFNTYVMEFFKS